jgi:hypothetical protein
MTTEDSNQKEEVASSGEDYDDEECQITETQSNA